MLSRFLSVLALLFSLLEPSLALADVYYYRMQYAKKLKSIEPVPEALLNQPVSIFSQPKPSVTGGGAAADLGKKIEKPVARFAFSVPSKKPDRAVVLLTEGKRLDLEYFDSALPNGRPYEISFPTKNFILKKLARSGIPFKEGYFPDYSEVINNSRGAWDVEVDRLYRLDFFNSCINCVFGGQIYDSADYGNLLWGAVMNWLGVPYIAAKVGSELNEVFGSYHKMNFWTLDSVEDQQAIRNGYFKLAPWLFEGMDRNQSIEDNLKGFRP